MTVVERHVQGRRQPIIKTKQVAKPQSVHHLITSRIL